MTPNTRSPIRTLPAFVKTSAFKAKTHENPDVDGNKSDRRAISSKNDPPEKS
jgi:hypothetical protein